eukprot:CAMPEP_0170372082 /NCGR_PEP_ID=MMETSP0117_2-20130122/9366_1 /TAXON_ID=400756 /ORGANISM="Durinskia baltica, Strain CSIRO CS-38" /LENGTH=101 /DNA_ID=CAMNT_0010626923 /DNA_START=117 /DNA_END=423 /DNA_ORIENTATION=-
MDGMPPTGGDRKPKSGARQHVALRACLACGGGKLQNAGHDKQRANTRLMIHSLSSGGRGKLYAVNEADGPNVPDQSRVQHVGIRHVEVPMICPILAPRISD